MESAEKFRLLEARTGDVRVDIPWRRDRLWINPHAFFRSDSKRDDFKSTEHITALIGKNGTGKSHLLSAIAQSFAMIEELKMGTRDAIRHLPLEHLSYRIDGRTCRVERGVRRGVELFVEDEPVEPQELPLPRRLIALTTSPFDKFSVPRAHPHSVISAEHSLYRYLGLRDRFGKASIETLLFRSLSSLFDKTEDDALRRINIGAVFEFLGLRPTLSAIYRLRVPLRISRAIDAGLRLDDLSILTNESQRRRIADVISSGVSEEYLRDLVKTARQKQKEGAIRMTANFGDSGTLDADFQKLQPLRRAGLLRLTAVEVMLVDGMVSDLRKASSGQLSMVASLLSLASVIANGSLVLIDEPELSLHPEWQVKYVDLLVKTFSRYRGCHFVVATHSPLVISELPVHADVISLDREVLPTTAQLAGQSADYLLAELFGLPSNGNRYVKEQIVEVLRLVAGGEARSEQVERAVAKLQEFSPALERDDPSRLIIEDLERLVADAGKDSVS